MRRSPTKRFLFRLALALGEWNPYAVARQMTARLLMEWMIYESLEPFDGRRGDYHAAQVAQMLYNLNRDAKKEPKGRPLGEFLLEFDAEELTDEQRAEKAAQEQANKMRVAEIIMRAQAEAAAGSRQPLPRVHEHSYEQPMPEPRVEPVVVVDEERLARALAAARGAVKGA